MFSRTLLVALCIVYVTPLTPLAPLSSPGDDDCALYLTGPGRSSAYDYSLNLLKGNFAYDGQHTCITYDAINQAYLDARTRILVSQPKGDWKAENFASVGELLLDVSISLARIYGLTYEEIEKGLPLIDTSRTLIREVCPPVFSHVECRAGKYRRLDGLCNNLRHPTWGAAMAPFQRLIGPLFADGINAPRISHTGRDLPLSRVVSRTMHPDDGFHDHAGTVMVIAWGQFMDHDYTLTGTPLDPIHRNDPEECCKRPPHLKHPYCNEIRVPDDDYFYRLFNVKCIDFVRGFPSPRPGCRLGSRVPFNTLTGAIDGNTVYGVTEKFARKLRTGYGGLLRMNPVFKEYGLRDLLPLKLDIPDEGCTRPNKNMFCFEAGEIRVNEQLVLTVMHTLMAREHNRVAEALALVNPHWDDETLFQESRRINIAEIQHITYNEFLPILLGKDVMEKFGLVLEKEGYWDGYDENVNPDVIDSFAAAAYRFGHSLLPTAVERWSKAHKFIASKRLSDLIRRPYDLYRAGVLDEYVMGLMNQVAQAMDDSITQEVTNHLFKKVGARFGMDLVSFNMQRGREFGLPGYMEFRKFCGLSGADSFQDLFGSMANETIQKYESIFEHPIDVDLWSGGVSERPLPGSMLGPTFACIIATQFSYSRRGDRFWFELPNQPSSFTPEQIVELRKARLARVICDNTDIIDTVQLYPMVLPDHELNPRVPCRSGIIPSIDFSKWAEPAPFHGGAKEYMTDAHICNLTIQENNTTATSDKTDDCIENDATNDFPHQDQCGNDDLVIVANNNYSNKQNETEESNDNLEENCENVLENLDNKLDKQIKNRDTVLKYVYKKADINARNKTRGHLKNSLKRKKRSLISESETHTDRHPRKFQINDQQTDREELSVPQTKAQGVIDSADLADFNIETLHENIKPSIGILLKDNQEYNKDRLNHHTKKYQSDESESNEDDDVRNVKSVYDDDDIPTNYTKNSKNVESKVIDYDEKDGRNLSQSDENDDKNIKNKVYDNDSKNNDYIDESGNVNSNEYIEKELNPQNIEDKSNEYNEKDRRDRERTSFNKDRSNDYTKKNKIDNNQSNEYEIKDKRGKETDSFNKNNRSDDYTKKSKYDSNDSNEDEVKDKRSKESDSFNKDDKSNEYIKKSKYDNNDSNEYEEKDKRSKESDLFNKDDRSNDYSKESKNDNSQSNEYEVKDKENIKRSGYENDTRKKQFDFDDRRQGDSKEEFLTNYKDALISDDRVEADSFGKRQQTPRNNESEKNFDAVKKPHKSDVSNINSNDDLKIAAKDLKHTSYESGEKADDIEETTILNKDNEEVTEGKNRNSSINLKEVDLDDFSHESIQDDKEQSDAPVVELNKSNERNSLPENVIARPNVLENLFTGTNSENEKQIKINDDEIKPVKELNNSESQSEEESKEYKESEGSENKEESISDRLKSIVEKSHKSHPISKTKHEKQHGDVKAQFERIPNNYIHNDVKTTEKKTDDKNSDEDLLHRYFTLDTFAPKNYKYDKDLNIKFSDLTIKLPEIKFPKDILAYEREETKNENNDDNYEGKEKDKSEDNEEEEEQEEDEELEEYIKKAKKHKNNKENREDFYQSYFNPQNEDLSDDDRREKEKYSNLKNENRNEEDSGEDLYEKFVRERFGKRRDLKKRSEKLLDYEPISKNYNLYKTVRKALKRANKIEKEAEKSKDPNYMWTLEYGGKL